MIRIRIGLVLAGSLALLTGAQAQAPAAAPPAQKSIGATLEVYVFPSAGQAQDQQSRDEAECYQWAVANTAFDPFEAQKQQAAQAQQAQAAQQQASQVGKGSGARGAVRGAAAGALIGEIVDDDAGKGAAYGAAAGVLAGRRRGQAAQQQAQHQVQSQSQQAQQAAEQQLQNFKKAFSVCLEGKSYMVKY